jgi:hypothetical protein
MSPKKKTLEIITKKSKPSPKKSLIRLSKPKKTTKVVKLKDVAYKKDLDLSNYFTNESHVMDDMIENVKENLKQEIASFNKSKKDLKNIYTSIQQLRGALDVLTYLNENYELVDK